MSLSDTCHESSQKLIEGLIFYADWEYSRESLSLIIDSIFNQIEFCLTHDHLEMPTKRDLKKMVDRAVIYLIIETAKEIYPNEHEIKLDYLLKNSNRLKRSAINSNKYNSELNAKENIKPIRQPS